MTGTLKTVSPPAVDRALSILEELAKAGEGLRLPEIAERLDIPKSSAHSLLLALERRGYLQRSEGTGRYLFGPKLFALAGLALAGTRLREVAQPSLAALMRRTGHQVHMAILDRDQVLLVEQMIPAHLPAPMTWLGKRLEIHCTALGKVLVAWQPEAQWARLVREHTLSRHNENTICTAKGFLAELKVTRQRGYALDDEEVDLGVRCVSVPVFDKDGQLAAAISVSGSTTQIHEGNAELMVRLLAATAAEITAAMAA